VLWVAGGRIKAQQVAMATNALSQNKGQITVPFTQALVCCFHLPSLQFARNNGKSKLLNLVIGRDNMSSG